MCLGLFLQHMVQFHFQQNIALKERTRLKKFIQYIFNRERTPLDELSVVFCSDEYLLEINQNFLHHDYYTDIITFSYAEKTEPVNGELYISVETIRSNAKKFGTAIKQELHRVIFHGVLHLCGYNDKNRQDELLIRKKEDQYLSLYFSD